MDKAWEQVRACLFSRDGHGLSSFNVHRSESKHFDYVRQSLLHSVLGDSMIGITGHRDV